MWKAVTVLGMAAAVSASAGHSSLSAAGQQDAPAAAQSARSTTPGAPRPESEQYCVVGHNERVKSGELVLANLDLNDVARNAPTLEKVARKLRGGTMPPEGRPRPDKATMEAFIAGLEASLDRHAAAVPNPGRVASRRLNRAEYVNAVYDLLGLEVNGSELLPSDMAGFGFDNNADVLAITPSLMTRYIAAATKISRDVRRQPRHPSITQGLQGRLRDPQPARHEDMPFASNGGSGRAHAFTARRCSTCQAADEAPRHSGTIEGIDEDEHEIEVRVDHQLVKQFQIGRQVQGS